jgi:hypothetical protein
MFLKPSKAHSILQKYYFGKEIYVLSVKPPRKPHGNIPVIYKSQLYIKISRTVNSDKH